MYVITFYSFKGGVGRTLALVNVGVHLALTGKSVLLVDFDLEAPGLDAFPVLRPKEPKPGIVDFVTDYLRTGEAPSVDNYLSECLIPELDRGSVRMMRSGFGDEGYSARLGSINWQLLYARRDGYLLLEDLKAQWKACQPDYVLIDSRTGFTDVGGICTRQFPDAVAAFFIPNEDNVRGLERIADDIRQERRDPEGAIHLHFAASNVPQMDDEEGILRRRIRNAGQRLGFDGPIPMIHRYESLALLDNEVFTLKRKQSRLAKEYRRLAAAVTARNYEDKSVALTLLQETGPISPEFVSKLASRHWNDAEVLWAASKQAAEFGLDQNAITFRQRAYELGLQSAEMLFVLSLEAERAGKIDEQTKLLRTAMEDKEAERITLKRTIDSLSKIPIITAEELIESAAFRGQRLTLQAELCEQMLSRLDWLPSLEVVLHHLMERASEIRDDQVANTLMLCLIGEGKYREAMTLIPRRPRELEDFGLSETFNYAVAEWGLTKSPPKDLFLTILKRENHEDAASLKNYFLCLSAAAYQVGQTGEAASLFENAKRLAAEDRAPCFSGWRYLRVWPEEFDQDLSELERMLRGEGVVPEVLRRNWDRGAEAKT